MKIIKNADTTPHIYSGQEIAPGNGYVIQPLEEIAWANDSLLLIDISNGKAVVNDGNSDITTVNDAIVYLKDHTPKDVVTQMEKNDKTLRCICAFATTDSTGAAKIAIPVPQPGRWIAYGDAEFETRTFGDYVSKIEIQDRDRLIAWQVALEQDPNATQPASDQTIIDLGNSIPGGPFLLYPILGHYDEKAFPSPMPDSALGDIKGGMAMTFQYGDTEVQPVAGYGFLPGSFYLYIEIQKVVAEANHKVQISIDWAEQN